MLCLQIAFSSIEKALRLFVEDLASGQPFRLHHGVIDKIPGLLPLLLLQHSRSFDVHTWCTICSACRFPPQSEKRHVERPFCFTNQSAQQIMMLQDIVAALNLRFETFILFFSLQCNYKVNFYVIMKSRVLPGVANCTMSGMVCCAGSRNMLRTASGRCMAGRFSNKNNQNNLESSCSDYLRH